MLERLRSETAALHEAIERKLDLLSPSLNVGQYIEKLCWFRRAFTPWEAALAYNCPPEHRALWQGREKTFRIEEDLRWLGVETPPIENETQPPLLDEAGLWLGSLYVMEGSTLGGRFIAQHLESHFGWAGGRGYSFFRGYGEKTAERWQAVRTALTNSAITANQIVTGADQTYGYLLRCSTFPRP